MDNQPSNMVIVTANRTKVHALGVITELPVHLSHMIIKTPVHMLDSQDKVLILGNDWLRKINAIVNWQKKELTISYKGRTVNISLIFTITKAPINSESVEDELEDKKEYNLLL